MSKSLVKSNTSIQKALVKRIREELNLKLIDVCNDAEARGMRINLHSLSKYFTNSKHANLPEDAILFLCYRYGIFVTISIGIPDKLVNYRIPDYNEEKCLKILNRVFPNGKSN